MTHTNPISSIFRTPSQKRKYRSLGVQSPDGNWAMGNRNPQSLTNMNCKTCVANSGSTVLPKKKKVCIFIKVVIINVKR